MADLTDYTIYANDNFKVLTDTGFQKFKGIIVGENRDKIVLEFDDDETLICTHKHKIVLPDGSYKYAKDLIIGEDVFDGASVKNIRYIQNDDKVYELLDVSGGHKYFINNKLSKNCLIIDEAAYIQPHIMDEFWNSVIPIISSSSNTKIFLISTANGTSNKFYDIYSSAESGESKEWHHEKMEWHELPGRGKKWKNSMIESLGSQEAFDQEFNCVHGNSEIYIRKKGEIDGTPITIDELFDIID
jgi:hypothetical protein